MPKGWRVPKKLQKQSFGAWVASKLSFLVVFLVPSSVLAPKLWFYLGPSMVFARFCSKMLPKPWGVPKQQSFGAKAQEGPQKTTPKLCFFLGFFWYPPAFWHQNFSFFGTLHGFGKVFQKIQLKSRCWQHCCSETSVFVGFYEGSKPAFGGFLTPGIRFRVRIRTPSNNEIAENYGFCSVFGSYMTTSVA